MKEENKYETAALRMLEKDIEMVIRDLSNDPAMDEFRFSYEKMYRALKLSHEREREILKNCENLTNHINENTGKIKAVLTIAQEDSQTIAKLKNELTEAKDILKQLKERDEASKSKIESLTKMLTNLRKITEEQQKANSTRIEQFERITEEKEKLEKDKQEQLELRDSIEGELKKLREELDTELALLSRTETERRALEKDERDFEKQIKKNEERTRGNRTEIDQLREEGNAVVEATAVEKRTVRTLKAKESALNQSIAESQELLRRLREKYSEMTAIREAQHEKIEEFKVENSKALAEKENRESNNKELTKKLGLLALRLNLLERNANKLEFLIKKGDHELESMKTITLAKEQELSSIERLKEAEESRVQEERAKVAELQKREEALTARISSAKKDSEGTLLEMKKVLQLRGQIEESLLPLERDIQRCEEEKKGYMKERQKLQKRLNEDSVVIERLRDDTINKDNLVAEFLKKIAEVDERLGEQKRIYENVRSDRNLYSKNLTETQDEIAEITKRIKIVAQQTDQLREELEVKEQVVSHELSRTKELSKNFQMFERRNDSLRQRKESCEEDIKGLINEIGKLKFVKGGIDKELSQTQKVYNTIVSERDFLGTELIQKNDEIAVLHERILTRENALKRGHLELGRVDGEIRIVNVIARDLGRELAIYRKRVTKLSVYQSKIASLNEMLLEEKLRVKALSEELENPDNLNRWRSVGSVELDDFELMAKIQTVQRKLIKATQEIVSTDYQTNAQQQTLAHLKDLATKGPGVKEAETFMLLQRALRMKTAKMKSLAAELNTFRFKLSETQSLVESRKEAVDQAKKRYHLTLSATRPVQAIENG